MRPVYPMQKEAEQLLANNKMGWGVARLVSQRKYDAARALLFGYSTHRRLSTLGATREEKLAAERTMLDALEDAYQRIESESERNVLLSIVTSNSAGGLLEYAPYTYSRVAFEKGRLTDDEERSALAKEFFGHPFAEIVRSKLRYLGREDCLGNLAELWNSGDVTGFLSYYDASAIMQMSAQRAADPNFVDPTLYDDMTTYEGLEVVMLRVPRAKPTDTMSGHGSPNLIVAISNKMSETTSLQDEGGWRDSTHPEFLIVTAGGSFSDLRSYLAKSLSERSESRGHGPYNMAVRDDFNFGTAANVLARLSEFVRTPQNFERPAQQRVEEQLELARSKVYHSVYAHRFLRQAGYPDWAAAAKLSLRFDRQPRSEREMSLDEATRILTEYGFCADVENFTVGLDVMDQPDAEEIIGGFVAGMKNLQRDMLDLHMPTGSDDRNRALDDYELRRGFHPDVSVLSTPERKSLAYQDLSDVAVGHLTSNFMRDFFFDDDLEPEIRQALSEVPFRQIAKLFMQAGDVTNFMRLLSDQEIFAPRHSNHSDDKLPPFGEYLKSEAARNGYQVLPKLYLKEAPNDHFRAVIHENGDVVVNSSWSSRYKHADEIVSNGTLREAMTSLMVMNSLDFPDSLRERAAEQKSKLSDFVTRKMIEQGIRKAMAEMDEVDRILFKSFGRDSLPKIAANLEEAGLIRSDGEGKFDDLVESAFEEIAEHNPRFSRVVKAIESVKRSWTTGFR